MLWLHYTTTVASLHRVFDVSIFFSRGGFQLSIMQPSLTAKPHSHVSRTNREKKRRLNPRCDDTKQGENRAATGGRSREAPPTAHVGVGEMARRDRR